MLVFIGSSTEAARAAASPVARIAGWLRELGHTPVRWDEVGVFPPGCYLLSRLLEISSDVDAAVFVYGDDDKVWYRGDLTSQPRDNVLIELGIFSHAVGSDRAILCRTGKPRVASDLQGLVYLPMESPTAESAFTAWVNHVQSRPKTGSSNDENFALRMALNEIFWTLPKPRKPSRASRVTLMKIVEQTANERAMLDWSYVTARQFMESIYTRHPDQTEEAYWWLVVLGAFRFRDIERFWGRKDTWDDSVDFALISERGKQFFSHLQRRRQLEAVANA